MIYGLNFCGSRDVALRDLMIGTANKYCSNIHIKSIDRDADRYGNGAAWEPSMLKIDALRNLWNEKTIFDYDWILSVDSDVVFANSEIFNYVNGLNYAVGITGMMQDGELADCKLGKLHHMSGCLIFLRGYVVKQIAQLSKETLDSIRCDFKEYNITENEDVVLSYLAQYVGAHHENISHRFRNGDFQKDILSGDMKSCYHLNYQGKFNFLGEEVYKWGIPDVLRKFGLV